MRLNPDCIRDILFYIEANTNFEIDSIDVNDIIEDLSNYDSKTLYYHIQMIEESEVVNNVGKFPSFLITEINFYQIYMMI